MTTEEKNKRLHEILGLHWHEGIGMKSFDNEVSFDNLCSCGYHTLHDVRMYNHIEDNNINYYTDAGTVQLLRELEKLEHGKLFFACILYASNFGPVEANDDDGFVERYSITTTGLLADKVIEWRNNGNNN